MWIYSHILLTRKASTKKEKYVMQDHTITEMQLYLHMLSTDKSQFEYEKGLHIVSEGEEYEWKSISSPTEKGKDMEYVVLKYRLSCIRDESSDDDY